MTGNLSRGLFPIARALLVATFVVSAIRHVGSWDAALDEMVRGGMPRSSFLLLGSIGLRLVGGLMIAVGWYARLGGVLVAMFVLSAAAMMHGFWAVAPDQRLHESVEFLNNLSMAGGAILVALFGPGPLSLDARLVRTSSLARSPARQGS